ncbi:DUF4202 domain-containing protein [Antarcticibacterium sp. 1MA-6-2]|uniref:DUF4202 domain-containing protein n=1 Tax=Antarcticibacterium sp. 1MA-6-2 TaxID=2908210 RepID=UPI001F1B483D|nr:DUF4202 domain-containing protein [Antarcticibacterium sp. 1MA-6-2]UJH92325.1 DUF4202 domain-containing protein [Antarcticibacterium sp. 1MA-6-2]
MDKFEKAISLIDNYNAEDPNTIVDEGKIYPVELLYSERMSQKLLEFRPDASDELQIAARAQHICRWKYPRDSYPMDRKGYLQWREDLKKMHADLTAEILKEAYYEDKFIKRVSFLIKKKLIKKDEESQTLEDVICLVFLQFYFEEFAEKHEDEKVISIIRKTWQKMSAEGHNAALKLPLSERAGKLVKRALA